MSSPACSQARRASDADGARGGNHAPGKTAVEKIISAHCASEVRAGDFAVADVDLAMIHDTTGPIAINAFEEYGVGRVWDPRKMLIVLDHASPSPNERVSNLHLLLRGFAAAQGITLCDVGDGVCHQIVLERGLVGPGGLAVGADSHTCTYGALGAFSFGIGSSDMSGVMLTGKLWLRVPATMKIKLSGTMTPGVYAKDLILHLIGKIGAAGADYLALSFRGNAIRRMSVSERATICNMVIECGAKVGIMEADDKVMAHMASTGEDPSGAGFHPVWDDDDAEYAGTIELAVADVPPSVSCPHAVDAVSPVSEVAGTPIEQVYIGTCTNGRLDDLQIAAAILKGRKIAAGVRLLVCPPSRRVLEDAIADGSAGALLASGATLIPPGCGPCPGTHLGVPGDGERAISTANRNFKGRMGNNKSFVYLASPATCAATALEGRIADPRKYLGETERGSDQG